MRPPTSCGSQGAEGRSARGAGLWVRRQSPQERTHFCAPGTRCSPACSAAPAPPPHSLTRSPCAATPCAARSWAGIKMFASSELAASVDALESVLDRPGQKSSSCSAGGSTSTRTSTCCTIGARERARSAGRGPPTAGEGSWSRPSWGAAAPGVRVGRIGAGEPGDGPHSRACARATRDRVPLRY